MKYWGLFLFAFFAAVVGNEDKSKTQTKEYIGLDAVHDIKIDKNTVISRNLKLERKDRRNAKTKQEDKELHWSYTGFPNEVSPHVEQFRKNMTECLKEVEAKEKKTVRRLSPKKDSPIHGECLIACVLKRNGVISNGKIIKGNLILLVSKFFARDTKLLKKLDKNVDKCIEASSKNKDECAMASQLNDCTNDLMASNKHKILLNY